MKIKTQAKIAAELSGLSIWTVWAYREIGAPKDAKAFMEWHSLFKKTRADKRRDSKDYQFCKSKEAGVQMHFYAKKCVRCGKDFTAQNNAHAKYCSRECLSWRRLLYQKLADVIENRVQWQRVAMFCEKMHAPVTDLEFKVWFQSYKQQISQKAKILHPKIETELSKSILACSKISGFSPSKISRFHYSKGAPLQIDEFKIWLDNWNKGKIQRAAFRHARYLHRRATEHRKRVACIECGRIWVGDRKTKYCRPCCIRRQKESTPKHHACAVCLVQTGIGAFLSAVLTRLSVSTVKRLKRSAGIPTIAKAKVFRPIEKAIRIPAEYENWRAEEQLISRSSLIRRDLPKDLVEVKKAQMRLRKEMYAH